MIEYSFDAQKQVDYTIQWIRKYFVENGNENTKAIIGISGGKDSTIAAALLVRALGKDKVYGVLMPQGNQEDIDDAYAVCNLLGIDYTVINIGSVCSSLYDTIDFSCGELEDSIKNNPTVTTNTPSRIRMSILYAVAAVVGGRVCNTGNLSEKWIGYTTKYGDLAGDFALLQDLTVREVLEVGYYLSEIPIGLIQKAPADGMTGKTDEDNMGVTYNQIDDFILLDIVPDVNTWRNMIQRHERNKHKDCINLPRPYAIGRKNKKHGGIFEDF